MGKSRATRRAGGVRERGDAQGDEAKPEEAHQAELRSLQAQQQRVQSTAPIAGIQRRVVYFIDGVQAGEGRARMRARAGVVTIVIHTLPFCSLDTEQRSETSNL